jgi:hypothetical protein
MNFSLFYISICRTKLLEPFEFAPVAFVAYISTKKRPPHPHNPDLIGSHKYFLKISFKINYHKVPEEYLAST